MKIAFCAPTDIHALARATGQSCEGVAPGLGSTATTPLIVELLRRGHELTVYTLSSNLPAEELYHWGKLRVFVGSSRQRHRARNFYRSEINYLTRVIQADAPQLVHAHWTYEFALGAIRSGISTVTTIHDMPWKVLSHFRDPYRFIRLLMAYEVAMRGQCFTAVSKDAALHFRRYFNPKARITVIPNGLPDSFFSIAGNSARQTGRPMVFASTLQGWSRRKNGTVALKAFAIVRRHHPNAQFYMFGTDYEQGGPAQKWAIQNNLDAGVTFVGPLPYMDLINRMKDEIDVLVHPSLDESFCMSALEAMALKKPVIAGRETAGVREVLGFGENGILVDVTSPSAVAEAMTRLIRDEAYRDHVAQSGFTRASSQYCLDTVLTQYESLYSSTIRN